MKRYITIGLLSVVLLILLIGILFKYQIISVELIKHNKEFIGSLKDILAIITITAGAFFSYYKFFKGRTFSLKAEINFDIKIFETPDNKLLHVIKIEVENKGTLTIWNPELILRINEYNVNGSVNKNIIKNWNESSDYIDKEDRMAILDTGEKANFIMYEFHTDKIWLVRYKAELKAHNNKTWQNSIVVKNEINPTRN